METPKKKLDLKYKIIKLMKKAWSITRPVLKLKIRAAAQQLIPWLILNEYRVNTGQEKNEMFIKFNPKARLKR